MVKSKPGPGREERRPAKAAAPAKAVPPPEPVPAWTGKIQIQATPGMVDFFNRRGARPDRGRSTYSLTNVLRQQFELFMAAIDESDPRGTRGFPQEFYDLTVELLANPWSLNADIIRLLEGYIARQAHLPYLLEQFGVERSAYLKAIAELTFAERLHLVEQAQIRHAPHPEPGSPDL
jgi:hypothetical protein